MFQYGIDASFIDWQNEDMDIIPASHKHATGVAAIWNFYIRETIATFNSAEKSVAEVIELIDAKTQVKQPILVAVIDDQVIGFATYGAFRSGVGYARVAEHTIQLSKSALGQGTGRMLMNELELFGLSNGIHSFFAGISGENQGAVKFHAAVGYAHVTTIPKVGWKFDRWHDLILMRKELGIKE